jgi:hypothetical protein
MSVALREHWGGVLGLAVGLVLLGGLVAALLRQPAQAEDPRELLGEWVELGELPAGLTLLEAATLPDGRRIVRLVDPDAPAEPELTAPELGPERVDWAALAAGPAGQPPREVLLVSYPRGAARSELQRLFQSGGLGPRAGGGGERRSVVLERDRMPWGELAVRYVHERVLEGKDVFRDGLRVNLSHDDTALVLFASWTRGLPASRQRVEELLAALPPRVP